MSESLVPVQVNNGQNELYLPAHVANEQQKQFMTDQELSADAQELRAQELVMGTDGHGSIRVEKSFDPGTPPDYEGDFGKDKKEGPSFQQDMDTVQAAVKEARAAKEGKDFYGYQRATAKLEGIVDDFKGRYNVTDKYYQDIDDAINGVWPRNAWKGYGAEGQGEPSKALDLWDQLNKLPDQKQPEKKRPNNGVEIDDDVIDVEVIEDDQVEGGNNQQEGQEPTAEMPELVPEIPLTEELEKNLTFSRDEFIRLSAKRRGIQSIGAKRKLRAAKKAYEDARDAAGSYVAEQMQARDMSPEQIRELGVQGAVAELAIATKGIVDIQASGDGAFKSFLNKWSSWGGRHENGKRNVAGFIKKGLVMTVAGAVVATPVGLIGGAILGSGAGAAAGVLVAQRVARGLMGAKFNAGAEGIKTGHAQSAEQFTSDLGRLTSTERVLNTADVTEGIQDLTDRSVRRNRRRAIGAAAIAAAAGAGTIAGAHFLGDVFGGTPNGKITMIDKKPGLPKGPTLPKGPLTEVGGGNPGVIELNPTDSRLPWTHVNDLLSKFGDKVGGKNSTPAIFDLVERGKQYGINITGKGRGLESVTLNGQTFTDNGHINAALDEIMRRTLVDAAEAQS